MELSLCRLKLLPRVVKRLDIKIDSHGLVAAMRRLLEKTGVDFEVKGKTKEIKLILKNSPALVMGNHPNESDLIVLGAALEPRKDVFIIANALLKGMSSSFDRHLLPVHLPNERHKKTNLIKLKVLDKIHKIPMFDEDKRRRLNRETIAIASEKINKGGLVAMFPGAGGNGGEWFPGVGYVVKGIKKTKTKVLMIYIENTSEMDYLRLIPGVSKLLKTIKVTFFKPIDINQLKSKEPKEIAVELHDIYFDLVAKITTSHHQN